MVAAALELRPRLFLMENVPGMQTAKRENLSFLEEAARMLQEDGGYRTEVWRLNASAFGVPQDRIRYFLVASRLRTLPAGAVAESPSRALGGVAAGRVAKAAARRGRGRGAGVHL
jgi:DNA (cytosine-5)-methyltransferase 1